MSDLEQDLHKRWLPSAEQMKQADALLAAGYNAERDSERGRVYGVFTAHLLIGKEYGFWTEGIELVFLDGVFTTHEGVQEFLYAHGEKRHKDTGDKLTGGWAWHSRIGRADVFEDIMTVFPPPSWSSRSDSVRCVCARHSDNSVTTSLCPLHAEQDPCLTMARVTAKRRRGSIIKGVCSACGWSAKNAGMPDMDAT